MAEISGIDGKVQIGKFPYTFPLSFISGSDVIGIRTWIIDYETVTLETTDFADDGIKTYVAGDTKWLVGFDGLKDGAPLSIGEEVTLYLYESDSAGTVITGKRL